MIETERLSLIPRLLGFPLDQRQGYATEACAALTAWVEKEQCVTCFVVSISPNNLPSLRLAQDFGFRKIGSHIDAEDGPEDIYRRDGEA